MTDHVIHFEELKFGLLRRLSCCLNISFNELIHLNPSLMPVFVMGDHVSGYVIGIDVNAAPEKTGEKIRKLYSKSPIFLEFYKLTELTSTYGMNN